MGSRGEESRSGRGGRGEPKQREVTVCAAGPATQNALIFSALAGYL